MKNTQHKDIAKAHLHIQRAHDLLKTGEHLGFGGPPKTGEHLGFGGRPKTETVYTLLRKCKKSLQKCKDELEKSTVELEKSTVDVTEGEKLESQLTLFIDDLQTKLDNMAELAKSKGANGAEIKDVKDPRRAPAEQLDLF